MKIAVFSEVSAADRNADILSALAGLGHEVENVGMTRNGDQPELSYLHTGFLSALFLRAGRADFAVGGCGTGQGYINAVLQYPGVVCGLVAEPLDGWLFARINGGNCVSLALNCRYGWAGDVNLRFLFEKLFAAEAGGGYPEPRRAAQRESRERLRAIAAATHRCWPDILDALDGEFVKTALRYPGVRERLAPETLPDEALRRALARFF